MVSLTARDLGKNSDVLMDRSPFVPNGDLMGREGA